MTQNRTDCHSVRGADGCLYALVDGQYQRVAVTAVSPREQEDKTAVPLCAQSDSLSARMMIDPGDGASARMMIDPGDGASARMMIDPGDGASARMMIDPGDGASARMMIDPGDGAQAQPVSSVN